MSEPAALTALTSADLDAWLQQASTPRSTSTSSSSSSPSSSIAAVSLVGSAAASALLDCLTELLRRQAYFDFVLPVNATFYPDYHRIVSKPMDLSSIWVRSFLSFSCIRHLLSILILSVFNFPESPGVWQIFQRYRSW
jgi:hypothetical protein